MTVLQCRWCGRVIVDRENKCEVCGEQEENSTEQNNLITENFVYVVLYNYPDLSTEIVYIFTTKEKAENYINNSGVKRMLSIEEHEIL